MPGQFDQPITALQSAFTAGEVSPQLYGRVDLARYVSALRTCRNFFVRSEGGVSNRPGSKYLANSISASLKGSVLIPFVFSNTQSYVCEFGAGAIQVFTLGALVATGISNPYAVGDLAALRFTQSADTLTVVHPSYPPYELKRTGPTTFTFTQAVYTNGPFLDQNTDGVTFVYASGTTGTVTLTSNTSIFKPTHVGALFQLTQQDISTIQPWEPSKILATGSTSPVGQFCRSNGKNYKCIAALASTSNTATGSYQPFHSVGTQLDGTQTKIPNLADICGVAWQFQDPGYGNILITQYISGTQVKGVVQAITPGQPALLPTAVVGGPVVSNTWTFSGDGSTVAFTPLTGATSTDPSKFLVTVNGVYQSPATYSIAATTLTFVVAPAAGSSNVVIKQINGLGQTSYWAFGAFSADQGYPSAVTYFPDRLVFAATPQKPVTVWGSKSSNYHDFGFSSPQVASDSFSVTLNARQLNAINDLIPLSDLIVGSSSIGWRLWPGTTGTALSPLAIAATPQHYYGHESVPAVLYGESSVYVQRGGRKVRDLIYQFAYDKFVGQELTLVARHLIPTGTTIVKMAYAPEPYGQLFCLRSDGILLALTYLREEQVIGWSRYDTQGTFDDIVVVPESGSFTAYLIANRTNGRFVEKFASREFATIYDAVFVDSAVTYDGRAPAGVTMVLTGCTTWQAGDTGTVSASTASGWTGFASTNPGFNDEAWLLDASGTRVRCLITGYTSPTQVSVRLKDPCPLDLQAVATSTWTFAKTHLSGAQNLANQSISVLADGNVVRNITVNAAGAFVLPVAGGVVQAGLKITADLESLALNVQGVETIRNRSKETPQVQVDVTESRAFSVGTDFNHLRPFAPRAYERYTDPTAIQDGIQQVYVDSALDDECHWCLRNDDPLPLTVRGVIVPITVGENG